MMTDIELQAWAALLAHETALIQNDLAMYGQAQTNPDATGTWQVLAQELDRRLAREAASQAADGGAR